jgi:hypothetical protein
MGEPLIFVRDSKYVRVVDLERMKFFKIAEVKLDYDLISNQHFDVTVSSSDITLHLLEYVIGK